MNGEKLCMLITAMAPWLVSLLEKHLSPSVECGGTARGNSHLWYLIYCTTECFGKQNEALASLNNPPSPTAVIVFVIFYGLSYNWDIVLQRMWLHCWNEIPAWGSLPTEPLEQWQMSLSAFLNILFWIFFYFCNKEQKKKKEESKKKTSFTLI